MLIAHSFGRPATTSNAYALGIDYIRRRNELVAAVTGRPTGV